jgi:F0F1-type ATP synthase beta subunit
VRAEGVVGVVAGVHVVVEGQARTAALPASVTTVRAEASGDDAVVETVRSLTGSGVRTITVTSDRELRRRVESTDGAEMVNVGPRWLADLLADLRADAPQSVSDDVT